PISTLFPYTTLFRFDKGFGTIIAERIIDLVFLIAFVIITVALQYHYLIDFISEQIPITKLLIILGVLAILAGVGLYVLYTSSWNFFVFVRSKLAVLIEDVLSIFKIDRKSVV